MNSSQSRWRKALLPAVSPAAVVLREARRAGAVAAGIARAETVDPDYRRAYEAWIAEGCNGTMQYLAKYGDVRFHPGGLLPGARSVVSMAFPYRPAGGYRHPCIASYALGQDYHTVLRRRLQPLQRLLAEHYGAASRVCVDTAPLPERYWAERAGVGVRGHNGSLIVAGAGSGVFLAEIITTLELAPTAPAEGSCARCGACIKACPGGAISVRDGHPHIDARRCLSYLTIEHQGEWPADAPASGDIVYGCDICQRVCPHNRCEPPEPLSEFFPRPELLMLDRAAFSALTPGQWRRLSRESAMSRAKWTKILANLGR